MSNGTISGDTTVSYKSTLLIPAVDKTLAAGSQNVNLTAGTLVAQIAAATTATVLPSTAGLVYFNGTVSSSVTLAAPLDYNAGTISLAVASPLVVSSGTLGLATLGWSNLPAEAQNVPVAIPFQGKPAASAKVVVAVAEALTVPANLSGTVMNFQTASTGTPGFTLGVLAGGTLTTVGTITINSGGTVTLPTASAVTLAAGNALVITAPGTQDASLADGCLTLMLKKV